jgi:hypothetical protein
VITVAFLFVVINAVIKYVFFGSTVISICSLSMILEIFEKMAFLI